MKYNAFSAIAVVLALSGCGPGKSAKTAFEAPPAATAPLQTSPEYDSIGVIAAVEGQAVTLDHEGASAAKLAAGRLQVQAYADVLAEAPLDPGARVAFKFRKVGEAYELTELKRR